MAGSLNSVQIIGHLGKDPEIRSLSSGSKVANLRVATTESWTKDGEKKEATEWHSVVVWGKLADICERFLTKGSKVYLSGQLKTRKWQDQAGADRYSTEIVLQNFDAKIIMLSGKGEGGNAPARATERRPSLGTSAPAGLDDDEMPF